MSGSYFYQATVTPTGDWIRAYGGTEEAPANFADLYAYDLETPVVLRAADISTSPQTISLIKQVRPAEEGSMQLIISASADRAGATISIAGLDVGGVAISEVLDISAAYSAPVHTTLKYKSVNTNGITVSGITSSTTITISQYRLGVVSKVGNNYNLLIELRIGAQDDVTTTHFITKSETVESVANLVVSQLSIFQSGQKTISGGSELGSFLSFNNYETNGAAGGQEKFLIYGSTLKYNQASAMLNLGGNFELVEILDSNIRGNNSGTGSGLGFPTTATSIIMKRVTISNMVLGISTARTDCASWENITMDSISSKFINYSATFSDTESTFNKLILNGSPTNDVYVYGNDPYSATLKILDPNKSDLSNPYVRGSSPAGTGKAIIQFRFNLKVVDKNGNPIESATVKLYDAYSSEVFSVSTDEDGLIAEQIVSKKMYQNIGYVATTFTYSPHRLEVTKIGYSKLIVLGITMVAPLNWVVQLKRAIPPAPPWRFNR